MCSRHVIRRIYPMKSTCPKCSSVQYRRAGSKEGILYRKCNACCFVYRVVAIAEEYDDGGAWSRVEVLG